MCRDKEKLDAAALQDAELTRQHPFMLSAGFMNDYSPSFKPVHFARNA